MAFPTTWRVAQKIEPARDTKKGDPQVLVHTDKGEALYVSGLAAKQIEAGDKIEISEPGQFGKGWYARLNSIDKAIQQTATPASSNGHGHAVQWADYQTVAKQAHALALELEPDYFFPADHPADQAPEKIERIDRSTARAAIVNTALIAFTNGKIAIEDDIPF